MTIDADLVEGGGQGLYHCMGQLDGHVTELFGGHDVGPVGGGGQGGNHRTEPR